MMRFWDLPPTPGQVLAIIGLCVVLKTVPDTIPRTRGEANDLLIKLNKQAEIELEKGKIGR
ncbi:hypothetical protein ES703_40584 [subsurface metagenome]